MPARDLFVFLLLVGLGVNYLAEALRLRGLERERALEPLEVDGGLLVFVPGAFTAPPAEPDVDEEPDV